MNNFSLEMRIEASIIEYYLILVNQARLLGSSPTLFSSSLAPGLAEAVLNTLSRGASTRCVGVLDGTSSTRT